MASSSSSRNWIYDVFPSFSGEDVRATFLSHFLKELDRKSITSFKDSEIWRSRSIGPGLIQAIRGSRIAVVVLSKNYAASSWCLDELVEIVKCKEEFGQIVIPVFYGVDPSHVRNQIGEFGSIFEKTCKRHTEEVKNQWKKALTDVANMLGFDSASWDNEVKMIEEIANDVLDKLLLTTSKDSEKLVGMEDHMAKMRSLLQLDAEEVRMVGIWGSSGIGKTTIARSLFNQLSRHFQGSVFIDRAFVSKSMENYGRANPDDYNMKLHLQNNMLSEIMGKRHIKIDHLGAVGKRLKDRKVFLVIDDLDDHVVLDALSDQTYWFGRGSRIIVTTKNENFLKAHRINHLYEVRLPPEVELRAGNLVNQNKDRWQLSKGVNHFLRKRILLSWENYPSKVMVSRLHMRNSNLEKLWGGLQPLPNLKEMDLRSSKNLKEIPDLSMATNLEIPRLVELLSHLQMLLPTRMTLQSLTKLDLMGSSQLWSEKRGQPLTRLMAMLSPSLTTLKLSNIPSLVELPSSFKNLQKLEVLSITGCTNLETLPSGMNLKFLNSLDLSGCSGVRSFPDISTNISDLILSFTAIEEVPWWIGKFARLVNLHMENCSKLEHVYMDISKLIHLLVVNFSNCWALTGADLSGFPSAVVMEVDNSGTELQAHEDASYLLTDDYVPKVKLNFTNCFNLDQEALLQLQSVLLGSMILSGEEVPLYFTHQTRKNSLTNIPLLQRYPSQPFFRLRVCAVVDSKSVSRAYDSFSIKVCCRFIDRLGNYFDTVDWRPDFWKTKLGSQLFIFDCCFPLHEDNAPLPELKYDHVDIQLHLINDYSQLKLKGCGVRFLDDGPSMDDSNNSTQDNMGGRETEHGNEGGHSTLMMSSLHNWIYHVFLSFNGEGTLMTFLIYSLKKMDEKLRIAFNDNEMKRSQSISPEIVHAIRGSRIAVIVFSKNYASSSWCLNELLEIMECKEKLGQTVIAIFYDLNHSDIRKQAGDFGEIFEKTCKNKSKELKNRWRVALTDAANIPGYHSITWGNEVKMIEEIANDVLCKLNPTPSVNLTPSKMQTEMSHDHDSYCSRKEELQEEAESVQGGANFNEKSRRDDKFLGEVNSDATSNLQKSIENKRVGPIKGENKHGKVSKSSTMLTYERHMSQHQVFISFWGEEVRFSFISHLVSAFSRKGVNILIGNYEKRSEDLGKNFQTIEDSNIALVVFSSRYTESRWCLDELVKIKERVDEGRLSIIPIFYKVEPSQVKQLEGDFGHRLWNLWRIHRDHRIIKWKDALEYVASQDCQKHFQSNVRMDFCLKEHSSESEFITLIVEKVVSRISSLEGKNPSFISTSGRGKTTKLSTGIGGKCENVLKKCPLFGLEQRLKQLEEKLEFDCNETRIIGVVGMAGIGKTTLAMMLHEKWNCKFVRCVPLLGIRKMAENYRPSWLRKTLLEVLLGGEFPVINDRTTHESLKEKLLQTKVFIVLDDVSHKKQLKFLLSDVKWMKNGSKVVITSRDKSLIEEFVHDTYVVPQLNYGEALQLFSYHAFGDHVVHPSFTSTNLCREFVDCAGGNPLIIKLLGKHLHGRDESQWEIRQGDLTHLGMVILNIFRFSCDELSAEQRDMFLDVACFFRSENDYFVMSLLDSGDHNTADTESEVRDLTHKCMIAICGGRLEMHDLLYMFGKIFSSQAFIEENGGKSRLWYTQEAIDALIHQQDTKSMRGIFLDMSEVIEGMELPRLTFTHMINLRYLKIYDSCCRRPCKALCKLQVHNELEFPLEKVRYLHWVNFPLKELPSDFIPKNLIDLRLPYSMVERLWQGVKDTPQLKWVDLSHSNKLLNLSGLAKAESLQRLNLEGCTNLDELPGEMQNMKSLVYLNLRGCIRLSSLPKMNLISLKSLILSSCSNLKEFQVISKSLEVLHLDGTSIKGLPPYIENLQRLVLFNLKNCKMLESLPNCLGQLKFLEELILSGCSRLKNLPDVRQSMKHVQILLFDGTGVTEMPKISCFTGSNGQDSVDMVLQLSGSYLSEWPRSFDGVSSLRRLCLSGNDFVSLQNDIGQLYNLTWLDVKQCKKLRSVPMLPPRLQYFDAHGCDSLEKVANPLAILLLTEQVHAMFNFSNCIKLDQDAQDSIISYTRRRSQLMLGALSRYNGGFALEPLVGTCFPGWEVPEWFSHRGSGSVLQPKLSPHWCDNRFTGIALCAVILFPGYHEQRNRFLVNCNCEFENEDGSSIHFSCTVGGWNELSNTPQKMELSHVFIGYTSRLDISKQGGYDDERCFCSKSSLEFQVTDGTEKVVGCEVLQCGFSLVYATDDRENIYGDAKTVVVPKRVKNVPGEEMSYGNSRRDDDFQYQSYSGPTLRRDENFLSERKSDATQNLRNSFGNRRFDLYKNPGGEVTISSHHYNTPTENVEKSSLVGVELRLKQLEKVLYSTPGKTRIVGVIGMPGIGKTTLAKLLFEKRGCKFSRNFFLTVSKDYISEELKRTYLEELLRHSQNISEETTNESVKDKLLQTKVFVVLNNVSDKKQLEFLLGNLNWINKGSKIVVTASDKSLVEGLAHETYVVPHLNNREAFKVFIYHAFDGKICIPTETFLSLSILFVDNVGGNPLALKLLGSELCGKDEAYWKHKLQTVIQNSNTKIQDVWRLYTDQLTERHKGVLLDIACFFRSEDEYFIKSLLDSGDPDSTDVSEVRDLAEKFLITICDGRVEMNDRHYKFCKDLGSRGGLRLWKYNDILDELRKMKQLEANNDVRGIFFDMSEVIKSIALERTTFINMHNLRYLKIYESCCPRKGRSDCKLQFPDGVDFPLEEVRYFHWLKYPLEELPPDFRPENLVDLRLPYSKVKRLWKGVKDIPRLKWVDLSHSSKLLNLSGLAKAGSLQRLNMEGCTNLDELPGEMQNMKSLVYLNMRGCIRLRSLPKMILTSLKTLILSDCSNLKEFQVISNSLEVLHLDGTAIKRLPLAIQKLQRLVVLNLKNCKMLECLPNCLRKLS